MTGEIILDIPIGLARLKDARRILNAGGLIRFVWRTGQPYTVSNNGDSVAMDGRSYHAFLKCTKQLHRIEHGSIEDKTLVIEWTKRAKL